MVTSLSWPAVANGHPVGGRAVIYVRVSNDRQKDGASLEVQLEQCRRYCEGAGLDVVAEFRDVQSGLDVDRPKYQEALSLAKSRGFDQLVVYRYDRSGRDDAEYMVMLSDFAKLGIQLVSATGESPDPLFQKLAGVLDWDESRRISIRVTGSKMKRFKNGYWSSKPPFGFDTERQKEGGSILVPKPGEAELIPQMFEMYATGRFSLREVQRWLNASLADKQKSRRGINQIFQSRVYLGEVPYGRYVDSDFHSKPEGPEWRPGKHQALVTPDMFDSVQKILLSNKRSFGKGNKGVPGPSRGGPNARYLFTGLIFCAICGSRYIGCPSGRNKWPNYRCGRKHTGVGCASTSVYEPRIRALVTEPIKTMLAQLRQEQVKVAVREELVRQDEELKSEDQVVRMGLEHELKRLENRLSLLEDAYLDGVLDKERYLARRGELPKQIQQAKSQLDNLPKVQQVNVDQLFAVADSVTIVEGAVTVNGEPLDNQAWREIIGGVVDRIVIEESANTDGRSAPAAIKVLWKSEYQPLIAMAEIAK